MIGGVSGIPTFDVGLCQGGGVLGIGLRADNVGVGGVIKMAAVVTLRVLGNGAGTRGALAGGTQISDVLIDDAEGFVHDGGILSTIGIGESLADASLNTLGERGWGWWQCWPES